MRDFCRGDLTRRRFAMARQAPALFRGEPAYAQKLPPMLGSYGGQDGGHGGRIVARWFEMANDNGDSGVQCANFLEVSHSPSLRYIPHLCRPVSISENLISPNKYGRLLHIFGSVSTFPNPYTRNWKRAVEKPSQRSPDVALQKNRGASVAAAD